MDLPVCPINKTSVFTIVHFTSEIYHLHPYMQKLEILAGISINY